MNVMFAGTSFDARHLELHTSRVKVGDIIMVGGQMLKVETIQRDCPSLESLSRLFVSWVLRTENGVMVPTRSLFGKVEVFRRK